MKQFQKSFLITFTVGLLTLSSFLAGYLIRDRDLSANKFPILMEARQLLLQHGYNEPPPDPALEYGMIRGMIEAYDDPYTSFSEPVQHELTSDNLAGKFGGIGVQINRDSEGFIILSPLPDSPALSAGVKDGDRLTQIEDMVVGPESQNDAVQAALRGKVGTKVQIYVERPPDFIPFDFSIQRAEYDLPSVIGFISPIDDRLGIIKVNIMAATTPQEILETVEELKKRDAQAFALDLRNNFGGLLTSGIDTARLFLEQGQIVTEQFSKQDPKTFNVEKKGDLVDINLVLLVNQNTASAAEITAGALQENKRSILIGTNTYGKDTIQLVFELKDGSSLQVSAARWWIPSVNNSIPPSISGTGLSPDIFVPESSADETDQTVISAVAYLFSVP